MAALQDEKIPSLLDVSLRRLDNAALPLQPLTRVCLAMRVSSKCPIHELSNWFEEQFQEAYVDEVSESTMITGLGICTPTGTLVLLEGSSPFIIPLLHAISTSDKIESTKVVAAMEDIPQRSFSYWKMKELNVVRRNFLDIESKGPAQLLTELTIGEPTIVLAFSCVLSPSPL